VEEEGGTAATRTQPSASGLYERERLNFARARDVATRTAGVDVSACSHMHHVAVPIELAQSVLEFDKVLRTCEVLLVAAP